MEKLYEQFDNLTDYEKSIILIYKSYYSYAINNIDNIGDEETLKNIKDLYEYYKEILNKPENMFLSYTFKPINNNSFNEFIESIRKISSDLNSIKDRIRLPYDMTVYRCVSMLPDDDIYSVSKGNLISTSESLNKAEMFINRGSYRNVTYEFMLKKGSPVLVVPYSIKIDENEILKVKSNDSQEEIILFKDSLDFSFNEMEDNYIKVFTEPKKVSHL